jgi:hypothetical protein
MTSLLLLAALTQTQTVTPCEDDPESDLFETTRLEMRIAAEVLDAHAKDLEAPPPIEDGDVAIPELKALLGAIHAARLPSRDGWDRPLRFAWHEGSWIIASDGPDGRQDSDTILGLGKEGAWVDDLVLAKGKFTSPSTVTMKTLRSLGDAIESFEEDHGFYPGPTGLVPIAALERELVPSYIPILATQDAWGNPILCFSEPEEYFLVSLGSDGEPQAAYEQASSEMWPEGAGAVTDPRADLLFVDGDFEQWLEGGEADE